MLLSRSYGILGSSMSFCFFKFYVSKLNYVVIQNDEESQNFVLFVVPWDWSGLFPAAVSTYCTIFSPSCRWRNTSRSLVFQLMWNILIRHIWYVLVVQMHLMGFCVLYWGRMQWVPFLSLQCMTLITAMFSHKLWLQHWNFPSSRKRWEKPRKAMKIRDLFRKNLRTNPWKIMTCILMCSSNLVLYISSLVV